MRCTTSFLFVFLLLLRLIVEFAVTRSHKVFFLLFPLTFVRLMFCFLSMAPLLPTTFRRRFNNYLTCLNENDGDVSACKKASYLAKASCPISWLAEWREQREEGRFAGVQAPVEDEDEE